MDNFKVKKSAYFTVCNNAYLDRALTLANSLFEKNGFILKIFLFEKPYPIVNLLHFNFCEISFIDDLDFERTKELAFKYDVVEFTTSLKPFITLNLLKLYDKVIFLDPDIYILGSFQYIDELLEINPVILTSHYNTPELDFNESPDIGMMRFGSFNLGFFAVNNSESAVKFLSWWNSRCLEQCYFESQNGLSTDQKWISIANAFFDFLYVIRDPGYNVAYWNLFERNISLKNNTFFSNMSKIVFFHFSNFDLDNPEKLTKRAIINKKHLNSSLIILAKEYHNKVLSFKYYLQSINFSFVYSFDYFSNGKYISPTLRIAFAANVSSFSKNEDYFLQNSSVYKFARKNNLLAKKSNFKLQGFNALNENKSFFKFINFSLRAILYILGPNRFYNISRLFIYLSSFRKNKDLWKV
jgi:hypothetical protein